MIKVTPKVTEFQAVQWTGGNLEEVEAFLAPFKVVLGVYEDDNNKDGLQYLWLFKINGSDFKLESGDYIIAFDSLYAENELEVLGKNAFHSKYQIV